MRTEPTPREERRSICSLKDVQKSYRSDFLRKRHEVLRGISFTIEAGETFAYLGHNGAGKTTTIKAMLGLIGLNGGELKIFGRPAGDTRGLARLGYLPENPYFYDHLSGREFLALAGHLHGLGKGQLQKRIEEVLELVNMEDRADRQMRSYSKGMLQRLGLAQALINDPELLILDEPMGGLDPVGRHQVRSILSELKARGTTIFMSSHILSDVESLADRAAILSEGQLMRIVCMADLVADNASKMVHCRQLPQDAVERFNQQGFVTHVNNDVTRIEVTRDSDLPRVLTMLESSGASLLRVEPLRSSLEDLFLREVSRGVMPIRRKPSKTGATHEAQRVVQAVRDVQEVRR